ncbi:HlyD family secretion protein [Algoriphagus persicinus]|uniref:HlyD family secretion protein n=1 Tax=Algoriphagus persicinus TaxID=3108754 RepID=UPI002B3A84F9|nr:HlyD family efflux transporter periplasmic adaptor subunit [Algoriphagus sp. E1-3-M2]MEB2785342.1 HlyD family efflux transporter periplasmic adaptor subunit [Algoriphagus sp. E1-3-M2]
MKKLLISVAVLGSLVSCGKDEKADGYGNFEATEITVSAEANGKIEFLDLDEGMILEKNQPVGLIDTTQLYLNKQQAIASLKTIESRSGSVLSQIAVLNEEMKTAQIEKERVQNMFSENAATQRQVDQALGKVNVINQQIKSVGTQNAPIVNEVKSIEVQIEKIEDQIQKSKIMSPLKGTVLSKYAEPGEITAFGKPLFKIGDISEMTLRVYIGEPQLPQVHIGQKVTVKIDVEDGMKDYEGRVSWISSSAEFTPKVIQTKEERVNLVYAVKIMVQNDNNLKIGMPAEMWINNNPE